MKCLYLGLLLVVWGPYGTSFKINLDKPRISLRSSAEGILQLVNNDVTIGYLGQPFPVYGINFEDIDKIKFKVEENTEFSLKVKQKPEGGTLIRVKWKSERDQSLIDCFDFGDKQWFGGPEQKSQYWPLQNAKFNKYSYVTKEDDNAAIIERYWLNSAGQFIYVDLDVPLFIDQHTIRNNSICFIADVTAPYSKQRLHNKLSYDLWFFNDVKEAHQYAVNKYLGKPKDLPDFRMIQHPIWSTWARYEREIDDEALFEYADEIIANGFNNSQFEIDDLWETCYGSLTIDEKKFPDFRNTVEKIKSMGFRVTIWIHPFINEGCEPWFSEALDNGYLVLSEEGSPYTVWWNSNGTNASHVDFTNKKAAKWWSDRVKNLLDLYDIDSVKFDAGENSWTPQIPVQTGDINLHPTHLTKAYVETCAKFGSQIEIRSGVRTQYLPVFIRMVDKDSYWGFNNGLATLITTLLQMNLNGYTLVLPDMIGGNGYNAFPSKELFIRWLQANIFMPTLQYSFAPWDYDSETVAISRKYTELHAEYAEDIKAAMSNCIKYGTPVNAPIWWLDPTDQTALQTWDEFLLGEDILVAPIVQEGAVTRDVYLPKGTWFAEGDMTKNYEGPIWITDYPAPLDVLPYFIRKH